MNLSLIHEPRDQTFVKNYGFFSFAKSMKINISER